jgi:sortase (surface protein transpeptidase)
LRRGLIGLALILAILSGGIFSAAMAGRINANAAAVKTAAQAKQSQIAAQKAADAEAANAKKAAQQKEKAASEATRQAQAESVKPVQNNADAAPKTAPPRPNPAPQPAQTTISIPSAGVNSVVETVGLTGGDVAVPARAVGRWNGSADFGVSGTWATFLVGHSTGVFSGLNNFQIGQTLTISLADGRVLTYRAVDKQILQYNGQNSQDIMLQALTARAAGGLNLMTCAGNYDRSLGTYNARLVIWTVPA